MHTITITMQGRASVSESIELSDTDALPMYVRLLDTLQSGGKKPGRRGRAGRPDEPTGEAATETPSGDTEDIR